MADPTCVYCKLPLKAHGPSTAGPTWFTCPDGTGRACHLDSHFRRDEHPLALENARLRAALLEVAGATSLLDARRVAREALAGAAT